MPFILTKKLKFSLQRGHKKPYLCYQRPHLQCRKSPTHTSFVSQLSGPHSPVPPPPSMIPVVLFGIGLFHRCSPSPGLLSPVSSHRPFFSPVFRFPGVCFHRCSPSPGLLSPVSFHRPFFSPVFCFPGVCFHRSSPSPVFAFTGASFHLQFHFTGQQSK